MIVVHRTTAMLLSVVWLRDWRNLLLLDVLDVLDIRPTLPSVSAQNRTKLLTSSSSLGNMRRGIRGLYSNVVVRPAFSSTGSQLRISIHALPAMAMMVSVGEHSLTFTIMSLSSSVRSSVLLH